MALVRVAVAFAPLARTITAPVLLLALFSAADVVVFSPVRRFFRANFGDFCSFLGIFTSIPWLHLWCNFFAPSVYSPLISILQ